MRTVWMLLALTLAGCPLPAPTECELACEVWAGFGEQCVGGQSYCLGGCCRNQYAEVERSECKARLASMRATPEECKAALELGREGAEYGWCPAGTDYPKCLDSEAPCVFEWIRRVDEAGLRGTLFDTRDECAA